MADYAWSRIRHEGGVVEVGEKVTAKQIGVDEDEYQLLKEAGSIREKKPPSDVGPTESIRERNARKLAEAVREAGEGNYDVLDENVNEETQEEGRSISGAKEVSRQKEQ